VSVEVASQPMMRLGGFLGGGDAGPERLAVETRKVEPNTGDRSGLGPLFLPILAAKFQCGSPGVGHDQFKPG
jgi:hypothetical protein